MYINTKELIAIRENLELIKKNNFNIKSFDETELSKQIKYIDALSNISFLREYVLKIKLTDIYKLYHTSKNADKKYSFIELEKFETEVNNLLLILSFILSFYNNHLTQDETIIDIKLPNLETFSELSTIITDLKTAIETPIIESNTGGHILIQTVEKGSIRLILSLGTVTAVELVGDIFSAGELIWQKNKENQILNDSLKSLQLEKSVLENVYKAQKAQTDNLLSSKALTIKNKYFESTESDLLKRLEVSLKITSDLIDRGTIIESASKTKSFKEIFSEHLNFGNTFS